MPGAASSNPGKGRKGKGGRKEGEREGERVSSPRLM